MSLGFVMVAAGLSCLGCADHGPKLIPVSGTVTLTTGQPIPSGYVTFHPDASKGNRSTQLGIGYIQDGKYLIKSGDREGLVAGWYKVTVDAAADSDPNRPRSTVWIADKRYTDKERSKLAIEAKDDSASDAYDLKLSPHQKAKK